MFERFTDRSRRVLVLAQEEVRDLNHAFIGTEHILLGLIREADGIAAKTLGALGVTYDEVREKVKEKTSGVPDSPGAPPFTPRAKKVLELSLREALQLGHNYIGTEHILLGLTSEGDGVAAHILSERGVELSDVREKAIGMMSNQRGSERSAWPTPAEFDSAILRGVVRAVGQQLRPDLGASAFDDRAARIADNLFNELRTSWLEPDSPRSSGSTQ
ncbi:MAG TPA: Clp protease N-terminal domain-containing protein [Acidimicrobiales bacterium]|jgi:ATP-dependent Clp protease ATP-binding subunit ClpC|nr:Clp protease N-terminal domain-containing protein [Acidimicrobiales bacterium]